MQGARTLAAFRGRDYAVPDDVVADRPAGPAASRDPDGRGGSGRPHGRRTADRTDPLGGGAAALNDSCAGLQQAAEWLRALPWLVLLLFAAPLVLLARWKRIYPHAPAALLALLCPALLTFGLLVWPDLLLVVAAADAASCCCWPLGDLCTLPGRERFPAEREAMRDRLAPQAAPRHADRQQPLAPRSYASGVRDDVPARIHRRTRPSSPLRLAGRSRARPALRVPRRAAAAPSRLHRVHLRVRQPAGPLAAAT